MGFPGGSVQEFGMNKRQLFLNIWKYPGFKVAFATAWREARQRALGDEALVSMVAHRSRVIAASAERDLHIWRHTNRCAFWNCCAPQDAQSFEKAQGHLTSYLLARARWIDANVGAMPGKLIQCLKSTECSNPVVLIDEIDKLGRDMRGDPSSALLEVLDPEQNSSFRDHYLDVPVDLSNILFLSTANVLDTIPGPLLDRMEIIRLAGYVYEEKLAIASKYLIPQTEEQSGIGTERLNLQEEALQKMIKDYAREAGVRNLRQLLEKVSRKVALDLVRKKKTTDVDQAPATISLENLSTYIGQPMAMLLNIETPMAFAILIVLFFSADIIFVVSRVLLRPQSSGNTIADLVLLAGRVLGSLILAAVALRLALGHWPWRRASNGIREVTRELTRQLSGERRETPLLDRGNNESNSSSQTAVDQLNADASSRQQQLKKLERGSSNLQPRPASISYLLRRTLTREYWSKVPLVVLYVFIAACSLRVAIKVVSLDTSDFWSTFWVIIEILGLPIMQLEYVLVQSLVYDKSSGEGILLPGIHEHMLYWQDAENKGFVKCSRCNEKVGELTGGFLILGCKQCTPNRWGYGGFSLCTNCYRTFRKNALKTGASGDASGGGILRGRGIPLLSVSKSCNLSLGAEARTQYIRRLSGQISSTTLVIVLSCVCCSRFLDAYIPKALGDIISALTHQSQERFAGVCHVCANASQDIAFYDNAMTGQMTSRLTNDMRQALSPVAIIMNTFVANIVMLVAGFSICLHASWRLTILAFTVLTPVATRHKCGREEAVHISAHFSAWAAKLMASQYTFLADAQGCATQALTNIRTVRMFGARTMEEEKFDTCCKNLQKRIAVDIS
eukprot:s1556_g4.t1